MSTTTTTLLSSLAKTNPDGQVETFEAETQLFGFTPVSFVDGIINAVNDYLFDAIDGLQSYLLEENIYPLLDTEESEQLTRKGINKLLGMLQASVDKNFDKFELYVLRNLLYVPPGCRVPGDYRTSEQLYSLEESSNLDDELISLRRRLENAKRQNTRLKKEQKTVAEEAIHVESFFKQVDSLSQICRRNDAPLLNETTAFVCDQAKELITEAKQLNRYQNNQNPFFPASFTSASSPSLSCSAAAGKSLHTSTSIEQKIFQDYSTRRIAAPTATLKDLKRLIENIED